MLIKSPRCATFSGLFAAPTRERKVLGAGGLSYSFSILSDALIHDAAHRRGSLHIDAVLGDAGLLLIVSPEDVSVPRSPTTTCVVVTAATTTTKSAQGGFGFVVAI